MPINHKGEFCWIKKEVFCQEGDCRRCQIYHEWDWWKERRYVKKVV